MARNLKFSENKFNKRNLLDKECNKRKSIVIVRLKKEYVNNLISLTSVIILY